MESPSGADVLTTGFIAFLALTMYRDRHVFGSRQRLDYCNFSAVLSVQALLSRPMIHGVHTLVLSAHAMLTPDQHAATSRLALLLAKIYYLA